ncbi:MAG TPA: hypothetical protein VGM88_08775 [Kofleriaceae bacterium]|jgi:hypothetical protein
MDALDLTILAAVLVVPGVLVYALRRTPVFWLPSALLAALGTWLLTSRAAPPAQNANLQTIEDGVRVTQQVVGAVALGYALVALVIVVLARRRAPAAPLPPATVMVSTKRPGG